ncbi:hypothetical protein L596_023249 [Steinernema carpocapsae]|uniref:SXP/RAL-2 family protein Ani s 5-like cation-binding domain-containing protein n=1 Tax=Steinernema carpocapsae TaxID=34508 RepID=A0A4V5ZZI0_STECR|nr:hypothetical protein L596_023249 [Steinernema carpocapsae]
MRLLVFSILFGHAFAFSYVSFDNGGGRMEPVIPEHHQVFALFMEEPTISFIISLGSKELEAVKQAKLDAKGRHLSDEEFSDLLGNYSKVTKGQFEMMIAENKLMQKNLVGNAKKVVQEIDDGLKEMDEQFTREDVKRWLVEVAAKLSNLTSAERDSIIRILPHKGLLMSYTGILKVRNMNDAEGYMKEVMMLYGQYRHPENLRPYRVRK